MGNYKHSQLKNKTYEEIERLFEIEMKRVNTFPMDQDEKSSKDRTESKSKRASEEPESDMSKKQKTDKQVEIKKDDDPEEEEMKKHMQIVIDNDILIRADGSSKRYSSVIKMLQDIDREDLQTLWKLVKVKHSDTRPEDGYERVLWGDLKVMFELDIRVKYGEVYRDINGEDRLQLNELMDLCTKLQQRVLDLENAKTAQDSIIASLKKRVKKLERRNKSRTPGLKRLRKVGRSARIISSKDEGLADQEDASKQGRIITDINADAEVTLIDETQERNDDNLMFDIGILVEHEVEVEKVVSTAKVKVTTASATTTTVDELTMAETLIEIKAAKPMVVTTTTITTTTANTRPKARGDKDKGKAKMVKPEKTLKKKDEIMFDKELAKQREEDENIAEWDDIQAMMDADYKLATRLHAEEQGELTVEEKSKLFVEFMNKRKKHFVRLRAEEQRRKPLTKAQKRNIMSSYLKNMARYKHNQLKTKSFEDTQMLFDKEMKRVNIFVDMDTELVKGNETRAEGSSKIAGEELKFENLKKQKLDENVEAKVDDDQEEEEMKKHMEIVPDNEVAFDPIPLATKPPIIVDWKIIKEGKMGYF
ncbi:hypothetical protein Tco_0952182 [Tanacetum coccineum]|uniref:Uncharacterized protein n=1 Tax=Tanacetum coccineum TaxID=301880 RepID=A0ABQ5DWD1_9ASTR